jgi:hypothetical protein
MGAPSGVGGITMSDEVSSDKEADRDSDPYWQGYKAGFNDTLPDCPYPSASQEALDWYAGYEEGAWEN